MSFCSIIPLIDFHIAKYFVVQLCLRDIFEESRQLAEVVVQATQIKELDPGLGEGLVCIVHVSQHLVSVTAC